MKNFITQNIKVCCQIIVDECDITKVLRVLATKNIKSNLTIGEWEWANRKKWCIVFRASDRTMKSMEPALRQLHIGEILVVTGVNYWSTIKPLI